MRRGCPLNYGCTDRREGSYVLDGEKSRVFSRGVNGGRDGRWRPGHTVSVHRGGVCVQPVEEYVQLSSKFRVPLNFWTILQSSQILHHENPLLSVEKAFYLLVNPGFIVGEAANLLGWDNGVLTQADVV